MWGELQDFKVGRAVRNRTFTYCSVAWLGEGAKPPEALKFLVI